MEPLIIRDMKKERQVRLRVEKGVVFLRSRGVPSVACPLMDLSENGCRCIVPLNKLDEITAERWRSQFEVDRQMSIDISAPPFLPGLHLDVEVKHVAKVDGGQIEAGLQFRNVESDERTVLNKALIAFATNKLEANFTTQPPVSAEKPGPIIVQRGFDKYGMPISTGEISAEEAPVVAPNAPTAPVQAQAATQGPAVSGEKSQNWFTPPEVPAGPLKRYETAPPSANDPYRGKRLGEILVSLGKITEEEVTTAYKATHSAGEQLGRYLLRRGWISPIELCSALSLQSGLPITDLSAVQVPPSLSTMFSCLTMLKHQMIPFEETSNTVRVASTHPLPPRLLVEMEKRCKKAIRVYLAEDDLVVKLLHSLQPAKERKLRKHARVKLNVPVTIQLVNRQLQTSGNITYPGKTIDISERGLMVCTREDLRRRGACLKVSFDLAPQNVTAWCSIRYSRETTPGADGNPWIFGLQILDMSEASKKNLKEICVRVRMWNMQDLSLKRRS
jgi:hypothetical protein